MASATSSERESAVNLPTITDGASGPVLRSELLGIAVLTPPRPTRPTPRGWWMTELAFARPPASLSIRPVPGRYLRALALRSALRWSFEQRSTTRRYVARIVVSAPIGT